MGTRYRGSGRDFIFPWELLLKLSTNIPIFSLTEQSMQSISRNETAQLVF